MDEHKRGPCPFSRRDMAIDKQDVDTLGWWRCDWCQTLLRVTPAPRPGKWRVWVPPHAWWDACHE